MNQTFTILEFNHILEQLADCAQSETARKRIMEMTPCLQERECRRRMEETTDARRILDTLGTPPIPSMKELPQTLNEAGKGFLLMPEQLTGVALFLSSCRRMKSYLKRAETVCPSLAVLGNGLEELPELREEMERCIRGDQVDDGASPLLKNLRRKIENGQTEIKGKLDQLLRCKKDWFADGSAVMRNGRWVLPVKKQYRNQISGTVVDTSSSGGTCFMEPSSVSRIRDEIASLEAEEDAEIRRILYLLTGLVEDAGPILQQNRETLETLDFAFAKGKLSAAMKACPAAITAKRYIRIHQGRHPLLEAENCVPLDFSVGEAEPGTPAVTGIVITGPNTGGKTVALKTVGLLSLMAQCGLHVPAGEDSVFAMHSMVCCDIGDGQSISQNLSTFSAHITNIIEILRQVNRDSLVLLDELGSGTDPAEGMGIAVAILEELRKKGCLFAATTHYPEVKEYAAGTPGLVNARMAFDRESLRPLYRLEIGEAGESCALYIAGRLGLPADMLKRAYQEAYSRASHTVAHLPAGVQPEIPAELLEHAVPELKPSVSPRLEREKAPASSPISIFQIGDSVEVPPCGEIGIVYRPANEMGEVCVQVKGSKKLYPHKRLRLVTPAEKLYPPDYDFSILFDTVENRKARHKMEKGHRPDLTVTYENESDWK